MNAQWATAAIAGIGILGNLCWTLVNLRIENKLLTRIDGLKEWVNANYEPRRVPLRRTQVAAE